MDSNDKIWSFNDRLKIIKNFQPYPKPKFVGNEDSIHGVTWGLYNRICENIKSFAILFENFQFVDAFILAGVALESCARLSFIKDRDNLEQSKEYYNKYLASMTLSQIIYNLKFEEDLTQEISWLNYELLLKIFYPVGKSIFTNKTKSYEDVIKIINYRLGKNADKISVFKKNFKELPVTRYTDFFFEKLSIYEANKEMAIYYSKYCSFKHSNMLSPGVLDEGNNDFLSIETKKEIADRGLYLILGLILYLQKYSPKPFI